ncbi:MAG: histidinol-phosphate transaminase [Chitinophagales bacterium]|nr:histidinol-phosphate transaminase [Chitinophagales bacterium]MDW8272910.1 histidinol-phosphate transaminase [Chitinophagales bacterium]
MFELQKLVRQNIWNLKPYSSARDEFSGKEGIFLDANENPFGTLNRYPDPYQTELRQALAQLHHISPENIFVGNGSDEAIDLLYRIFCRPSLDKALTFTPTYGMYEVSANINEVIFIKLPLNQDFQINIEQLRDYLNDENLKLIFICSPNNPTGNLILNIDYVLKHFKGIVVLDEAYIDFSDSASWISEIEKYQNLVVLQTFSKAKGLAAARVGMAFASRPIVALMHKIKPPYNVSKLNQEAALQALKNRDELEKQRQIILSQRKVLEQALSDVACIKKIFPSQANFLLIETTNGPDIYQYLLNKKIITRNRSTLIQDCIRITVGTEQENKTLIDALKQYPS